MKRLIVFFLMLLLCGAGASMKFADAFAAPGDSPAKPEPIRYQDISGDYLFVKNLDETEKMSRSLREYLGDDSIQIQSFVPEDAVCLAECVWDPAWAAALSGGSTYCVEAWDIFKDGVYLQTSYEAARI